MVTTRADIVKFEDSLRKLQLSRAIAIINNAIIGMTFDYGQQLSAGMNKDLNIVMRDLASAVELLKKHHL